MWPRTVTWNGWELAFPIPEASPVIWYGGHFGSGREPSGVVYNPAENGRMHAGIDLACDLRTPMYSLADGDVTQVDTRWEQGDHRVGGGNMVVVRHQAPWGSLYWHRILHIDNGGMRVKVGDKVKKGQLLALAGTTGASAGYHYHGELTIVKPWVDAKLNKHVDIEFVLTGKSGRKGYEMVTVIQQKLTEMGYDPGPVDGIMGEQTENALRDFMDDAVAPAGLRQHRHANRWAPKGGWVNVLGKDVVED